MGADCETPLLPGCPAAGLLVHPGVQGSAQKGPHNTRAAAVTSVSCFKVVSFNYVLTFKSLFSREWVAFESAVQVPL